MAAPVPQRPGFALDTNVLIDLGEGKPGHVIRDDATGGVWPEMLALDPASGHIIIAFPFTQRILPGSERLFL
jgi:hypothetical protein